MGPRSHAFYWLPEASDDLARYSYRGTASLGRGTIATCGDVEQNPGPLPLPPDAPKQTPRVPEVQLPSQATRGPGVQITVNLGRQELPLGALARIEPGPHTMHVWANGSTATVSTRAVSREEVMQALLKAGIEPNPGPKRQQARKPKPKQAKPKQRRPVTQPRKPGPSLLPKGAFRAVGSAMGGLAGGLLGAQNLGQTIGGAIGGGAARLLGMGDYATVPVTNPLMSGVLSANNTAKFSSSDAGIRVVHKEALGSLSGSVAFDSEDYSINPGNVAVFPWLGGLSRHFTRYKFNQLIFVYIPTSGTIAGTNPSLGSITFSANYDPAGSDWDSRLEMQQARNSTTTVPNQACAFGVECDPAQRGLNFKLITASTAGMSDADKRLMQWAKVQIATEGQQSVYTLGDLWVLYDVTLTEPRTAITHPPYYYATLPYTLTLTTQVANAPATVHEYGDAIASRDDSLDHYHIEETGLYRITATAYCATENVSVVSINVTGDADYVQAGAGSVNYFFSANPGFPINNMYTGILRLKRGCTVKPIFAVAAGSHTAQCALEVLLVDEDSQSFNGGTQNTGLPNRMV